MPSSHAFNWFAATMVALVYYRRSVWFMLPAALLVGFSRVYNGVHFPSDVLAGAILGAGYAAAMLWLLNSLWLWLGQKWFPLWWERMPSLLAPPTRKRPETPDEDEAASCSWPRAGEPPSPPLEERVGERRPLHGQTPGSQDKTPGLLSPAFPSRGREGHRRCRPGQKSGAWLPPVFKRRT